MRYSGIQPQYFPRLHYFARILAADVFMLRDDVQFVAKHKYPGGLVDKSYQAHTPVKQPSGRFLMAVPVAHHGYQAIKNTAVSYDHNWVGDHLKTLHIAYGHAPYIDEVFPEIEMLLTADFKTFGQLNTASIYWGILRLLGEAPVEMADLTQMKVAQKLAAQKKFRLKKIRRASESAYLSAHPDLGPNEKIIALLREVGADEDYCGGTSVAAYVDHGLFEKNSITITVQDWQCAPYPQLYLKQHGFIPNLSIIDLLMNVNADTALKLLA